MKYLIHFKFLIASWFSYLLFFCLTAALSSFFKHSYNASLYFSGCIIIILIVSKSFIFTIKNTLFYIFNYLCRKRQLLIAVLLISPFTYSISAGIDNLAFANIDVSILKALSIPMFVILLMNAISFFTIQAHYPIIIEEFTKEKRKVIENDV